MLRSYENIIYLYIFLKYINIEYKLNQTCLLSDRNDFINNLIILTINEYITNTLFNYNYIYFS